MEEERKTALVLCGGGFPGYYFEAGVMAALEETAAAEGRALRFDLIVGTSVGAVLGVLLSAGFRASEVVSSNRRQDEEGLLELIPGRVFTMDGLGLLRRAAAAAPRAVREWRGGGEGIAGLLLQFWKRAPSGFLDFGPLVREMRSLLARRGTPDEFGALGVPVRIPAYEVLTARRRVFPDADRPEVTPCVAAAASCSAPVFFESTVAGEHAYVDGGLGRGAHLDIAVDEGAERILVVHVGTRREAAPAGGPPRPEEIGFLETYSRTLQIVAEERFQLEMSVHEKTHPEIPTLLVEPIPGTIPRPVGGFLNTAIAEGAMRAGEEAGRRVVRDRRGELEPFLGPRGGSAAGGEEVGR